MIFAIGDIHGRADMLHAALTELQLALKAADTVVFLGDYIDRGDDSRGVIESIMEFKAWHEKTVCLRGNDEQMLLDALAGDSLDLWLQNGGMNTARSYKLSPPAFLRGEMPGTHLDFLKGTLLEWESVRFHFVHAGLVPPSRQPEWSELRSIYLVPAEPRLWIRREFIASEEDFGKIVVFGHTVQKSHLPLIMANKVGLDTGAVFGGRLTVGILDNDTTDLRYFQVGQDLRIINMERR